VIPGRLARTAARRRRLEERPPAVAPSSRSWAVGSAAVTRRHGASSAVALRAALPALRVIALVMHAAITLPPRAAVATMRVVVVVGLLMVCSSS
jgi:hypothetical protein